MKPIGILLIVVTTLFPAYQLFSLPNIADPIALFSQYLGLAALILMAWGQILSTRLPVVELAFGGLDRVYVLHKWAGIAALTAILLHDTIDAEMDGLGAETLLVELAETLGELSLYGLLILVVISVATFIPYHLWKWTHKAMGAFFIAGSFHFVFILKPFAITDPAGLYTGVFCAVGIAAYLWMLLPERLRRSRPYVIQSLEQTGGALAITMRPEGRGLRPQPGQFGVVSFTGSGKAEPHPFSFSKIDADGTLRVTIKALGDFTSRLPSVLAIGQNLRLQGPFGRFRLAAKGPEIWVAGGIGITPFLTWASALPDNSGPVDLFYCVRSRDEAPHLDALETSLAQRVNIRLHLVQSSQGQRLSGDMIAAQLGTDLSAHRVAVCGPVSLRKMLKTQLARHGVSARNFHYEEFEFRTGIGLRTLAAWVLDRSLDRARKP